MKGCWRQAVSACSAADYTGLTIADLGLNPTSNDPLVTQLSRPAKRGMITDWHGSTASAISAIISNWRARP